MSSIGDRLTAQMKDSMRARDQRTLDLVRMLKSRMGEKTTQKGFSGEVDDALWLQVIGAYAKSQKKAIDTYRAAGDAGLPHIEQIEFELAFCDTYLPQVADAAQTRAWVETAIAGLGGAENAKLGAVMGTVMKGHRGAADATLVREIAAELLA